MAAKKGKNIDNNHFEPYKIKKCFIVCAGRLCVCAKSNLESKPTQKFITFFFTY